MYLAFPHSRGWFQQDFSCPAVLKFFYHACINSFRIQDYHLLWSCFPAKFYYEQYRTSHAARHERRDLQHLLSNGLHLSPRIRTPEGILQRTSLNRFGLIPFRSPLLRECKHLSIISFLNKLSNKMRIEFIIFFSSSY